MKQRCRLPYEAVEHVPTGEAFEEAAARWLALASDEGALYDTVVEIDANEIEPFVTWGTNPSMGSGISKMFPMQI